MSKKKLEPTSLGKTKSESFGSALQAAVRVEFGSNKEFAKALGVSQGRVSQLIRGPEDVNTPSLVKILVAFQTRGLQERVHEAWIRQFAPLPIQAVTDLEPEKLLSTIHTLGVDGLPTRALAHAKEWRHQVDDPAAWQALTRQIVEINLRLTKVSGAVSALDEMQKRALARGDKENLMTALWMSGLVLRTLDHVTVHTLDRAHQEAVTFAEAHKPASGKALEEWETIRAVLDRDFALHVLALNERKPLKREALEEAAKLVERSIQTGTSEVFRPYGLEVKARLEAAMGQLFKAEETLAELESSGLPEGSEIREKADLTAARIKALRGERDEAEAVFEAIAEDCFERLNLHHHRVADQLLARLRANL
ncbi:MAG TPA: hypothetical protein VGL56_04460 [Fimbriimonadaceae bacterium]|jgi:hypothetical protein